MSSYGTGSFWKIRKWPSRTLQMLVEQQHALLVGGQSDRPLPAAVAESPKPPLPLLSSHASLEAASRSDQPQWRFAFQNGDHRRPVVTPQPIAAAAPIDCRRTSQIRSELKNVKLRVRRLPT